MTSGRLRHILSDDSLIDQSKSWLRVRKIPETNLGLQEVDRWIHEFKEQLSCGYWTHPMDIYEIKDGLVQAMAAYDYLYSILNKDFSHYGFDGGTQYDRDKGAGPDECYTYTGWDQVSL